MDKKRILIITDSSPSIRKLAEEISAIFGNDTFSGYTVSAVEADNFTGDNLLPAHVIFVGCELPKPDSFTYLDDFFRHICLAGRPFGIFSTNAKTLKYLSRLIRVTEASLGTPLLVKHEVHDNGKLIKWVQSILKTDKNVQP